jgi:hypothetical protein
MSRGPGELQRWILDTLKISASALSAADLRNEWGWRDSFNKRTRETLSAKVLKRFQPASPSRSLRMSMGRALRNLEAAGEIKRDERGNWYPAKDWSARDEAKSEDARRAYHEAGHAVIARSKQLPVGFATIKQKGRMGGYVTGIHDRPNAVGLITKRVVKQGRYKSQGKIHTYNYMDYEDVADLHNVDAFGNPLPTRRMVTTTEHEAEILMCIAGGMAEAEHKGDDPMTWRKRASSADMSIARHHRELIGNKARPWEEYERETLALIREHWSMIEAVAAELLKHETLSGFDIDDVCCKVVRRQHLKRAKRKNAA